MSREDKELLKKLQTEYNVTIVTKTTDGYVQYKVKSENDTTLIIRIEEDYDSKYLVKYTTEKLQRKPFFDAVAICEYGDVVLHVESLICKHLWY